EDGIRVFHVTGVQTCALPISMALSVARAVGQDLARAIGPAHGIGRPRWEALVKDMQATGLDTAELIAIAERTHRESGPDVADPRSEARRVGNGGAHGWVAVHA